MLHFEIAIGISPEGGHMVYFQHPGFKLVVKHNIEAQEITAEIRLLCLRSTVQVLELWLNNENGFDYDLLDLMPDNLRVFSVHFAIGPLTLKFTPENFLESELMHIAIKLLIILIERIVSKMNKWVIKARCVIVLFSGKTNQSIVIDVDGHRADY